MGRSCCWQTTSWSRSRLRCSSTCRVSRSPPHFIPSAHPFSPLAQVLDVSGNRLGAFPNSLLDVAGIERLNFANNDLLRHSDTCPFLVVQAICWQRPARAGPSAHAQIPHPGGEPHPQHSPRHHQGLPLWPPLQSVGIGGLWQRNTPALLAYLKSRISDPDKIALLKADERTLADQAPSSNALGDSEGLSLSRWAPRGPRTRSRAGPWTWPAGASPASPTTSRTGSAAATSPPSTSPPTRSPSSPPGLPLV